MELLVRLIDKSADEKASKRGDIICAQPDGWAWSNEELTNPDWMVVKVTSLLNTDRDTLLSQAQTFPAPGRFRRREWFVDFSKLALPNRFNWPRSQQSVTITRLGFVIAITQKPALV